MNDLLALPLFELVTSPDVDGEHEDRARFDVRSFVATEAISTLFKVEVTAHHVDPGLDFLEIVGAPASFRATGHGGGGLPLARTWSGVVSHMEQTRAVAGERDKAYSTYELTLVPRLWLLTQRRNYRIFQFKSELAIALEILAEWEITVEVRLDPKTYRGRKYKVQYAETDYEFVYRILSEVGICFFFEHKDDESVVVLTDAPHLAPKVAAIGFQDTPSQAEGNTFVTSVRRSARIRPNAILLRDRDYRKDSTYELQAGAHVVDVQKRELAAFDRRLEGFYYPENFNFLDDGVDETSPHADSKGLSRTDEKEARRLAMIDLGSRRNDAYVVELESNDLRLSHGVTFLVEGHPADEINGAEGHLVVESRIGGRIDSAIHVSVEAVSARRVYRATLAPKPRIIGLESATVVGAAGEEIDCDEFGRVKVHFHWDRYGKRNDESSCWIPVSQTWGGAGMGGGQIPRIGHEVLVEFLAGDPDRPIITGRVFTAVNKIPLKLPACKTQTILQSQSTGGGGGHNMIRMEDSAGNEHLDMRAQKDMNVDVLNDSTTKVAANSQLVVGGTETRTFTSPQPGAPRTVQTNCNGLNKMEVGAVSMVEVTPGGVNIRGTRISLYTAAGANITLEGSKITFTAAEIEINGQKTTATGKTFDVNAETKIDLEGGQIFINREGAWPAGRYGDEAPDKIMDGSGTVFIGGPSVKKMNEQMRADTLAMLDEMEEALTRWNEEDQAKFKEWFGDDSSRQEILNRIRKAREQVKTATFHPAEEQNRYKPGLDGYVYGGNDDNKIFLGMDNMKSQNRDGRAGTVIHEEGHFPTVAGTADDEYDVPTMKQKAKNDPAFGRKNSGNWAWWGLENYGRNPKK